MDMKDNRIEAEKRLSEKLNQLDLRYNDSEFKDFEKQLERTKPRNLYVIFLKSFGFILLASITAFLISRSVPEYFSSTPSDNVEKYNSKSKTEKELNNSLKDEPTNRHSLVTSIDNELEKSDDELYASQRIQKTTFSDIRKVEQSSVIPRKDSDLSNESTSTFVKEDYLEYSKQKKTEFTSSISRSPNSLENLRNTSAVKEDFTLVKTDFLNQVLQLNKLPLLHWDLNTVERDKLRLSNSSNIKTKIIDAFKRISFGFQYAIGKNYAADHETPFVSPNETTILGLSTTKYGIFGQVNLDRRSSFRSSFSYSKIGHQQTVDSLRFNTAFTNLILEAYAHEIIFGLDYSIDLIPNLERLDIRPGVGFSYSNLISVESNNFYTNEETGETVSNKNEIKISPFSYKFSFAIEANIYNNIVLGIEPFVIYQSRTAKYTPSIFIADQGSYNIQSGLNLTCRF